MDALAQVGLRLRAARTARGWTLDRLARAAGVSASTISRLESGRRQASLELLLPLTRSLGIGVDDLIAVEPGDPRVRRDGWRQEEMHVQPLSPESAPVQAMKLTYAPRPPLPAEELHSHPGHDWCYVISGRLRLQLGEREILLHPGEAAEFDTVTPHAFSAPGPESAEVIGIFNESGEHVRTRVTAEP
ncbi:XRE family transcriptional regulator [Nesterenkonia halophila]